MQKSRQQQTSWIVQLTCILLLTLAWLPDAHCQPGTVVPCTFQSDSVIVNVKINGTGSARLLLDTGATYSVITRQCAARLHLVTKIKFADDPDVRRGRIRRLTLGALALHDVPFCTLPIATCSVFDKSGDRDAVDGVLGIDTLRNFAIGMDMPGRTLTLWPRGKLTVNRRKLWFRAASSSTANRLSHPVTTDFDLDAEPICVRLFCGDLSNSAAADENNMFHVMAQLDGLPLTLGIDTGTTSTCIPKKLFDLMTPLADSQQSGVQTPYGVELVYESRLKALRIGGFKVMLPAVQGSVDENTSLSHHSILGMDVFEGHKLLLDFPARRLFVSRGAVPASPVDEITSRQGLLTGSSDDEQWLVVCKGSPAEKAGLHTGDVVIEYDRLVKQAEASGYPSRKRRNDQDGMQARHLSVRVRRKGQPDPLEFMLDANADFSWADFPANYVFVQPSTFEAFPRGGTYYFAGSEMAAGIRGYMGERTGKSQAVAKGSVYVTFADGAFAVYAPNVDKSVRRDVREGDIRLTGSPLMQTNPPPCPKGYHCNYIRGHGWLIAPPGTRFFLLSGKRIDYDKSVASTIIRR